MPDNRPIHKGMADMGAIAREEVASTREIWQQLSDLESEIITMRETLTQLETRLEPVLNINHLPDKAENQKNSPPGVPLAPLAEKLRDFSFEIRDVIRRMRKVQEICQL